jgi:pyruvate/2-oxoglutarate dehydrogenase complex dihydrolipoamide dehydrogenase (E3) component
VTSRLVKELAKGEITVKVVSAKFLDHHTVQISSSDGASEKITANNIIIAIGSEPSYKDFGPVARAAGGATANSPMN